MISHPRITNERTDPEKTLAPTADPTGQRQIRQHIHATRAHEGKQLHYIPTGTILTPEDATREINRP